MSVPDPISQAALDDLRHRLLSTRRVPLVQGVGWDRGTDPDYLADLVAYWGEQYDWRAHEARLLAHPWATAGTGEDKMRVIHRPAGDAAPAVVLLHGWPDSFFRFDRVLPLLEDVSVVVPCLPGFPYSYPSTKPGMSTARMAEMVAAAMTELGYERFVLSGGDVGSSLAENLAATHPDRVTALHLTDIPYTHLFTVDPNRLSQEENDYLAAGQQWQFAEGAYALEQATKPHSLAAALGDSPPAWLPGSWRSCAVGVTATATSSRRSRATTC